VRSGQSHAAGTGERSCLACSPSRLPAAALVSRGAAQWFDLLTQAGVPAGPINDLADAFDLASQLGLDPDVPIPGSLSAVSLNRSACRRRRRPSDCLRRR
jgi:crotonobetainyl-CoA:carnitine CoA-transferase CaiB-like acyl-CoA transferase